jgi:predicted ester cyclase
MKGGHSAVRKFLATLLHAFPDLRVEVEILVDGKDRIAWQRTLRGTHRGSKKGFPASGRKIVWRDMITSRFRDGRIAEDWVITKLAERLLLARKRRRMK